MKKQSPYITDGQINFITEEYLLDNEEFATQENLDALKSRGVSLAIEGYWDNRRLERARVSLLWRLGKLTVAAHICLEIEDLAAGDLNRIIRQVLDNPAPAKK